MDIMNNSRASVVHARSSLKPEHVLYFRHPETASQVFIDVIQGGEGDASIQENGGCGRSTITRYFAPSALQERQQPDCAPGFLPYKVRDLPSQRVARQPLHNQPKKRHPD